MVNPITQKVIFFASLDWGLGHATRSAPLLQNLAKSNEVIIGVTSANRQFYTIHFPGAAQVELPSYDISYSTIFPAWFKVLLQWPSTKKVIRNENLLLDEIVRNRKIDIVISDSRLGLWNRRTHNIIITHQLKLKAPFFSKYAASVNARYINNFSEVWVPDFDASNKKLSGDLSDPGEISALISFLGPQSMLQPYSAGSHEMLYDVLILLSGPEPQRTKLEEQLVREFADSKLRVAMVRGTTKPIRVGTRNIKVFDLIHGEELANFIRQSNLVICRSGYSSLMDMHVLGKRNLRLIPTPGQPEQEYLADYWKNVVLKR